MRRIQKLSLFLSVILYCASFSLFALAGLKPVYVYTIVFILTSVLFISIIQQVLNNNIPRKYIYILFGLSILLRIIFIPVHPIGSDDYYRYAWDGKVQASGINPYKYTPADTALNKLHSNILPRFVNFPDMKTIYPPLSQIIFYISYLIGGEGFIGIKIFLLIADFFSLWVVFLILRKLNLPDKNILIYALCALPLFQYFLDAHLDGLGLPLFLFTIYFYLKEKKIISLLFLTASISIKPLGIILLPIFFFNESGITNKAKVLLIPGILCLLSYLPYIFTGTPFQALMRFTEHWTFNGVVFDILDMFFKNNQRTRLICGVIFILLYAPIILSRKDLITKIYLSLFLLYIFSPVVHPWYLGWLAVLLPFIPRWSGITYVSLISLTSFTILNYQLTGNWKEFTPVLILEYVPVIILFIYELNKYEFKFGKYKAMGQ